MRLEGEAGRQADRSPPCHEVLPGRPGAATARCHTRRPGPGSPPGRAAGRRPHRPHRPRGARPPDLADPASQTPHPQAARPREPAHRPPGPGNRAPTTLPRTPPHPQTPPPPGHPTLHTRKPSRPPQTPRARPPDPPGPQATPLLPAAAGTRRRGRPARRPTLRVGYSCTFRVMDS